MTTELLPEAIASLFAMWLTLTTCASAITGQVGVGWVAGRLAVITAWVGLAWVVLESYGGQMVLMGVLGWLGWWLARDETDAGVVPRNPAGEA